MPVSVRTHEQLDLVSSTFRGTVTARELLDAYRALYESETWQPGMSELVDLRGADVSQLSSETLGELAAMRERHAQGQTFRSCVLAPDDLPFGLARIYEALSRDSPEQIGIFRTRNEALDWLGLSRANATARGLLND